MLICFSFTYFLHIYTFCLQRDMTQILSVWNISFIKQYWRYLHSGEVSVNQENWTAGIPRKRRAAGALFPIISTWSRDFDKYLYPKYSYTHMCKWVGIFKVTWPHCDDITSSWGGVSTGLLSQELYLANFVDDRPSRSEDYFNFTL